MAANTVVLVIGWYQISIAKYLGGESIFRVRVFTLSGSTGGRGGGRDAKTIISPNTSFGDIITEIPLSTLWGG